MLMRCRVPFRILGLPVWIVPFYPPPPSKRAYSWQNDNCTDPPQSLGGMQGRIAKVPQRPHHEGDKRNGAERYSDISSCIDSKTTFRPYKVASSNSAPEISLKQRDLIFWRENRPEDLEVLSSHLIVECRSILLYLLYTGRPCNDRGNGLVGS